MFWVDEDMKWADWFLGWEVWFARAGKKNSPVGEAQMAFAGPSGIVVGHRESLDYHCVSTLTFT